MSYGKLNFFKSIQDELHHLYMNTDNSLANLNISFTRFILSTMNVSTPVLRSSQLNVNGSSTHLLISLCREVGATSYLSGLGANNYLDTSLFVAAGIDLEFSPPVTPKPYPHCFTKFGSHTDLSVVDFYLTVVFHGVIIYNIIVVPTYFLSGYFLVNSTLLTLFFTRIFHLYDEKDSAVTGIRSDYDILSSVFKTIESS